MKNKIFIGIFLIVILLANISFASYSTVTMTVVEEPVCTIQLDENSKFEKKLISKDLTNKEITIQLQVTNDEIVEKPTGEIMLVLDNSSSMTEDTSSGKIRKDLIFESTKTLISNLLKDNTNLKVGIVQFSTNIDVRKEGTIDDASIVSSLSNDASYLNNAISTIETNGARTNLQSGLLLASQQFTSENNNKYMIILTDGVPNVAIDYNNSYYSDDVINKTKQQLQLLNSQGIKITTMLTGISNESYSPSTTDKTFGQIITEIFGTQENPTVGNFYYVTDSEIESTIVTNIYNDLVLIEKSLKNITIIDYFPEEIVKNFDFAYVTDSNIGNISPEIDTTNNSITWTIPELASGETATVQYKLKLKEDFDSSIVDKILNTNEKVDIDYTNVDDEEQEKTSDVSPKIKLIEPVTTPKEDKTQAPTILPSAGSTTLISFIVLSVGLLVFSIIKIIAINKKIK